MTDLNSSPPRKSLCGGEDKINERSSLSFDLPIQRPPLELHPRISIYGRLIPIRPLPLAWILDPLSAPRPDAVEQRNPLGPSRLHTGPAICSTSWRRGATEPPRHKLNPTSAPVSKISAWRSANPGLFDPASSPEPSSPEPVIVEQR